MYRIPETGENKSSAIPSAALENADTFRLCSDPILDFRERRQHAVSCKRCGSGDTWRVNAQEENVLKTFLHRDMKPFQCRACGDHFYLRAQRKSDSLIPIREKKPGRKKERVAVTWVRVMAPSLVAMGLLAGGWQWRHFSAEPAAASSPRNRTAASVLTSSKPLTNDDVITLKIAGFGDSVVIERMRSSPGAYRLEADDLVQLRSVGISEAVIAAMLETRSR